MMSSAYDHSFRIFDQLPPFARALCQETTGNPDAMISVAHSMVCDRRPKSEIVGKCQRYEAQIIAARYSRWRPASYDVSPLRPGYGVRRRRVVGEPSPALVRRVAHDFSQFCASKRARERKDKP